MFYLGSSGEISLSRGDTATIEVLVNQGTALDPIRYVINGNDEVYFGLMEPNQPFEHAILKKKLTVADLKGDDLFVTLNPKDTRCLLPGLYYYQIKLKVFNPNLGDYAVNTIIPKTRFYIEE